MITLISNELERVRSANPAISSAQLQAHMNPFTSGLWTAFRSLNALNISENVAHNKKANADPDHWYNLTQFLKTNARRHRFNFPCAGSN